ncbi:MAG: hypothetical protein WCF67_22735 [Chitinophagaceae bacterium]
MICLIVGGLTSALPSKPITPEVKVEEIKDDLGDGPNNNSGMESGKLQHPAIIPTEYTQNTKYQNHIWIPIHITKNETAVFAYPKEISENDIKIVEHQLAGIATIYLVTTLINRHHFHVASIIIYIKRATITAALLKTYLQT